jgi:hypothetical protein
LSPNAYSHMMSEILLNFIETKDGNIALLVANVEYCTSCVCLDKGKQSNRIMTELLRVISSADIDVVSNNVTAFNHLVLLLSFALSCLKLQNQPGELLTHLVVRLVKVVETNYRANICSMQNYELMVSIFTELLKRLSLM